MPRIVRLVVVAWCLFVGPLTAQEATRFSVPALVMEMTPGVVHIAPVNAAGKAVAYGSGFVVDGSGLILTAFHVIRGAAGAMVKTYDGEIYDRVEVVQYDLRRDVAVLKIHPFRPLKALHIAERDDLEIGSDTAAIGNPQGLEATVSAGIVSGYRQADGFRLLQTTAPVSPGSSGGPLFDMSGNVIGMVSSAIDSAKAQNLNFAIPAVYLRTLLQTQTEPIPLGEFSRRVASAPTSALRPVSGGQNQELTSRVKHLHSNRLEDSCEGVLSMSNQQLTFVGSNVGHTFDLPLSAASEVLANVSVGRAWYAFHIRFRQGENYNFVVLDDDGRVQQSSSIVLRIRQAKGLPF